MNKEQWQQFEEALAQPWGGGARLLADGHDLVVRVMQVKPFRFSIVVYIDGAVSRENTQPGSALGSKFYRATKRCAYSSKEKAYLAKEHGKRWAKSAIAKGTFTMYDPKWGSASALRRHLQKSCKEIQLLRAGHEVAEVKP